MMLQISKVLVIGDSHVRRMMEFHHLLLEKLYQGQVDVEFRYRGGARLDFAEQEIKRAHNIYVVMIMVGGNDLDSGA